MSTVMLSRTFLLSFIFGDVEIGMHLPTLQPPVRSICEMRETSLIGVQYVASVFVLFQWRRFP